jgi:hypothetical protein
MYRFGEFNNNNMSLLGLEKVLERKSVLSDLL